MPTKQPPAPSAVSRIGREYWSQSRRPLSSLALVLPLLLLYEGGLLWLGTRAVRNGADVWLRQLLDALGFTQYFLLPLAVVALLLGWHHVRRERWQVSTVVLSGMFVECAVLALVLVAFGQLQGLLAQMLAERGVATRLAGTSWIGGGGVLAGRLLGFAGAGVYEEMLFRLLPLPPLLGLAKRVGARGACVAAVVIATSLAFAAAHYLGPRGESWDAFTFWFRFSAGATFALLFVYRGFGIAAVTHALYDVFISLG